MSESKRGRGRPKKGEMAPAAVPLISPGMDEKDRALVRSKRRQSREIKRPAPVRPGSKQEARQRLATLAEHLADIAQASGELRFAKQAIGEFLEGKYQSLDHAFGIRKGRGKPKQPAGKHLALIRDIETVWRLGDTWSKICEKLGRFNPKYLNGPATDADYLGKLYGRYLPNIALDWSDKINAGLKDGDAKSLKARRRVVRRATKKMSARN